VKKLLSAIGIFKLEITLHSSPSAEKMLPSLFLKFDW